MWTINKIDNKPIPSCCYVVYDSSQHKRCLIIDPGSQENDELYDIIGNNGLEPEYIILTHEHFDHCLGVNNLRTIFPNIKLVCSKCCNEAIQNEKKNCSLFWDYEKRFEIAPADMLIEDIGNQLDWRGKIIDFVPTPGHSLGSFSILIGHFLFTGDAYIPGLKTVTKLPGGNKQRAAESETRIRELITKHNLTVCPGHGEITLGK